MKGGTEGPIVVIVERLGPYHVARLRVLSETCQTTVIQFVAEESTYKWERLPVEDILTCKTVFRGESEYRGTEIKKMNQSLVRLLKELRPSTVAITGWSEPWALGALAWCSLENIPAILLSESHEVDFVRFWAKEMVKRRVVRLFSGALVGGKPHIHYAVKLGIDPMRVRPGYDVVDNEYFKTGADEVVGRSVYWRDQLMLPEKYFLVCSRFVEKKNIPRLIEAYERYRLRTGSIAWGLVFVGDGPEYDRINALVREKELQNAVIFAGFKQYRDLPAYYGLAGAFLHVSTTEQWGLVVNEAMASGLPVIVSDRCGCALDLVENGINGFTCDPYNVDGLADLMEKISSAECDRVAMGLASHKIISHWTLQTFTDNLLGVARAAMAASLPISSFLDRSLLWALMRLQALIRR